MDIIKNPETKLSRFFKVKEFIRSDKATALGIDNSFPDLAHFYNSVELCKNVLDPIRRMFGAIRINSGIRCLQLNEALGSNDDSHHILGCAADIEPWYGDKQITVYAMYKKIIKNRRKIPFMQCIYEKHGDKEWIHISYFRKNRGQYFTSIK